MQNLEAKLAQPIKIPSNPFWKVLRTFGRDELIGAGISILSTAGLQFFIPSNSLSSNLALALIGPITEKIGFFFGHIADARETYLTTAIVDRKPFSFYCRMAFKGWLKTVIQDVLVHDPLYVILMLAGMSIHPATPAWLLVPIAFTIAVLLVAAGEVSFKELQYWWFKRKLFKVGFETERYLEARFCLEEAGAEAAPRILRTLQQQFLPGSPVVCWEYTDRYYATEFPSYNARTPKMRLRSRVKEGIGETVISAQIIYIQATEDQGELNQYRFFPQLKEKLYLILDKLVSPQEVPGFKTGLKNTEASVINFTRYATYDSSKLLISIDHIKSGGRPLTIIEVKAYPDQIPLLKETMRYIMHHYAVQQTTHGKVDLLYDG